MPNEPAPRICGICRLPLAEGTGYTRLRARTAGLKTLQARVTAANADAPKVEVGGLYAACQQCADAHAESADPAISLI